jgi:hypothetical protein
MGKPWAENGPQRRGRRQRGSEDEEDRIWNKKEQKKKK